MHWSSLWITRWMSTQLIYIKQSVSSHRRVIFLSCFAPGGFITLCLLQMNNFTFSFGKKLGKKKKERETGLWWDFMAGFPWMSLSGSHVQISVRFTHCSRLPSAPRGISRAGWPVGVRASGCIFYLFFWPCHLAENVVWQATKPTVTKQGIDWIISVSSDRPPAASNTAGINGCQSYREEIGNLFVSEFNVLHLMFCSTL